MEVRLTPWLARLVNALARLDPEQRARSVRFAGKRVALVPGGGDALTLVCLAHGGWRPADDALPSDLTVHFPRGAVLGLLTSGVEPLGLDRLRALGVRFEGDLELARDLQRALRAFHVDWEEHLSRLVGDVPAHLAGRGARALADAAQSGRSALRQNISDYLRFEAGLIPIRGEVTVFLTAVDALRDDVARLEARIRMLQTSPHALL